VLHSLSAASIINIYICVASSFSSTIQSNEATKHLVLKHGGFFVVESITPCWISQRFTRVSNIEVVREVHCANCEGIRFPTQSQAILHNRWIISEKASFYEALIKVLAKNDSLDYVNLDFTEFDDSHLEILSASDNITQFGISGTKCTDAGMKHLRKYKHLQSLYICELRITDVGAAHIAKCRTLKYLNIYDTSITPAGLDKLFKLLNLETLVVTDKKEYKATLAKWKQKRPKVKVVEIEPANDEEGNPRAKEELPNRRRVRDLDTVDLVKQLRKALQKGR
jgi:hypothetical protein